MFSPAPTAKIPLSWLTLLLLFSVISVALSSPLHRRALQAITPGAEIPPTLVDLQDQLENLSGQLAVATPGTPDFNELTVDVDDVRNKLTTEMNGVAIFVADSPDDDGIATTTTEVPVLSTDTPAPTAPTTVPTVIALPDPLPPSSVPVTTVITITPTVTPETTSTVSTVATQEVTTVVVTTSRGATSTVTLATQTVLPTIITTVIKEAPVPAPTVVTFITTVRASTTVKSAMQTQAPTTTTLGTASKGAAHGSNTAEVDNGALSMGPSAFLLVAAMVVSWNFVW